MKFPELELRAARIEIVPMIDTIFFLLVFFMYSTMSMVKMHDLALNVPRDGGLAKGAIPSRVTLTISAAGACFIDGRRATLADMPTRLERAIAVRPGAAVVVDVSPAQSTQTLVSLLDVVSETLARAGSKAPIIVATPADAKPGAVNVLTHAPKEQGRL